MPRRPYRFEPSGVRIAYETTRRNTWSRLALDKARTCVSCNSAMAPGREAFRPLTEHGDTSKGERACLACVLRPDVVEQGDALGGGLRTFHVMRGDVIRAEVEGVDRFSLRCVTCAEKLAGMNTGRCEHVQAVRDRLAVEASDER